MAYAASRCHAMLIPSGTFEDPDRKHLFVVCSDACADGKHVLVSITGWTNDLCDGTTRLKKGDHPFLYKDSYVFYRKARIEDGSVLTSGIDSGAFVLKEPMDAGLVDLIMEGICASKQTPRKVKKYAGC
ncbi:MULTISPECIES: hypothetical protein [Bradyrhizobium]|uniref:hypothetical protein n=1 Tax=Bradyrhizobium TaxID=374 RepID=UPI00047F66A1|nr:MULTISPECIES: hypothetical protein [Bradyrhizobium]UFW49692.1 hypothetical protein BaraCB756_00970 [Bradyrhizobium arachidis]